MTPAAGSPSFSPEAAEEVHEATLSILEEVGVRVEDDLVADKLVRAGARRGRRPQEILFPRQMVAEFLSLAPSTVTLSGRDGSRTTLSPDGPSVFWTVPCLFVLDGTTHRPAMAADLANISRLADRLPSVQAVVGIAMEDVPPDRRDVRGLRIIADNTRKHIRVLCFSPKGMEALVRMKPVFPGAWFSIGFTAHGPLRWTSLALRIFAASAGCGIPATINGEPMAGVTGPVTLAGSVCVGNAEILSGIVINQVLEPGRPCIYNLGLAHTFDMRCATAVTGGPENALFARASAGMARFYRLPSSSWASTEAVFEDEQAGMEKGFQFLTHLSAGVSVIWGVGQLESEKTISLAQMVIDDEIISFCQRYLRGFQVTRDTLCLDLIKQVGIAGNFLDTDHTLSTWRDHLFLPSLFNRRPREMCPHPLHQAARQKAFDLLSGDAAPILTDDKRMELEQIEEEVCG